MKRGTPDHPKTKRLAEMLGLARWEVVGLLESLWHYTASYSRRGNIGRWSDEEIASAIRHPGGQSSALAGSVPLIHQDRPVAGHLLPQAGEATVLEGKRFAMAF